MTAPMSAFSELIVVKAPAVDWLTLTSYDRSAHAAVWQVLAVCVTGQAEPADGKRMQYVGRQGDGWFHGDAMQGKKRHYMTQVSGALADEFMRRWRMVVEWRDVVQCSRLDMQITVPDDGAVSIPALGVQLRESAPAAWGGRGVRPSVSFISNDDGRDTLYIGSRQSDRYTRIYVKEVGVDRWLRYEVECKGDLAASAYAAALSGHRTALGKALASELGRLPAAARATLFRFTVALSFLPERLLVPGAKSDAERTFRWLNEVVLPSLAKVKGGIDSDRMQEWLKMASEIVAPGC